MIVKRAGGDWRGLRNWSLELLLSPNGLSIHVYSALLSSSISLDVALQLFSSFPACATIPYRSLSAVAVSAGDEQFGCKVSITYYSVWCRQKKPETCLTLLFLRAARSCSRRNLELKRAENLRLRFASSAHLLH